MDPAGDKGKKKNPFFLEKWFLDVVTDKGDAFIFYAAKMKWGFFRIPYKSMLYIPAAGKPEHHVKFSHVSFPVREDKIIKWSDKALRTEGTWSAACSPIEALLIKTGEGELQWNCFQPSSVVNAVVGAKLLSGRGYAEQLVLTMEPWKLPVHTLQWGRFVSAGHQMVWIEIQKDETKQWVWYNGERIDEAAITNRQVNLPSKNIRLDIVDSRPAETNNNIQRVLAKIIGLLPGIRKSIPAKFLLSEEHKEVSRGQLFRNGLQVSGGWVIHEIVHFKF